MPAVLSQNINFPIVLRLVGWLLMIESQFMLLPMGVAWYYGENHVAVVFLITLLATLVAGVAMAYGIKPTSRSMRKREGLLLTSLVWIFFSIFGMIPFLATGALNTVTDAFFETMAGFTTTGSSVIVDLEKMPHGILLWRSLMQWIGGLGIILFTLAVLPMLNYKGGIALFNAEVTGITHERMRPRVNQTAKSLWIIYLVLTIVLGLMLYPAMGGFDATCHALSTISTGGFSTKNDGLIFWHSYYIAYVVMAFMFLGGINFSLIYFTILGKFKRLWKSSIFKWYVAIIIICASLILLRVLYQGDFDDFSQPALFAVFDTISAITSTGYSTASYESTGEFISILLMVVMFFGGMAGSTSGGAKLDRFVVLVKNCKNELYKVLHPNSVTAVWVDGKAMPQARINKVTAFLSIYVIIIFVVAIFLTAFDIPLFDALFSSMSVISNVGLGYGVTGADGSWALLPDAAKWILSLEMLIGRLELFTVLVVFSRSFWVKD